MIKQIHKKISTPGDIILKVIAYLYFVIFSIAVLLPFYILLKDSVTSFEESSSTMEFIWFPKQGAKLTAYESVLFSNELEMFGISIFRAFFNSLWQVIPTLVVGLFVSGLAAFAYAKLRFPGKDKLFMITLATMMIPGAVLMMPTYVYFVDVLKWGDSVLPMVIPGLFGGATTIFFMRQFFRGIPTDLLDAAKLDGLGFMGQYTRIMIPLSKPAFISQFIFGFIGGYNDYMGPLLYINGQTEIYPLQMALTLYQNLYRFDGAMIAALTLLAMLPLIVIYVFMQKYFIEGIAVTGIKG